MKPHLTITGTPRGLDAEALLTAVMQKGVTLGFLPRSQGPLMLSLSFVDGPAMARLNKKYRGKNKPTDILSFETDHPHSLGDLVICTPVLRAQARDQGHDVETELAILLVHGFLHLLGYDHERSKGAALLQARAERKILKALGYGQGLIGRG